MATMEATNKERARNMRLLGHHDLDGFGRWREGIALQALPDGRRILYSGHGARNTAARASKQTFASQTRAWPGPAAGMQTRQG